MSTATTPSLLPRSIFATTAHTTQRDETPPPRLVQDSPLDDALPLDVSPSISHSQELDYVDVTTPSETYSSHFPVRPAQRRRKVEVEKIAFRQSLGRIMNISPGQLQRIQNAKLVPVTEDLAHPPLAGLLFRYFDENSHGKNGGDGFVAGRFVSINGPRQEPPACQHLPTVDVENHMNRNIAASPFVSTSDNLIWLLRLAMKETAKGARKGCIAIIDAHKLHKQSVYWAKPFHAQLNDYFVWTDGAWRYPGSHEFLVWDKIDKAAIVKTVTVNRLFDSIAAHGNLQNILELNYLTSHKGLKKTMMPYLKARNIPVAAPNTVSAIAAFAAFMGLGVNSPYKHIEHFAHEVVLGWGLAITQQSLLKWADYALCFVEDLCRYTRTLEARIERKEKMKVAFLYGIRNALAGDWNVLVSPDREKHLRKMHNKARIASIQDPPAIIRLAFEIAVKKTLDTLNVYGATQDHVYGSPTSEMRRSIGEEVPRGRFHQFLFASGNRVATRSAIEHRKVTEVEEQDSSDFEMLEHSN